MTFVALSDTMNIEFIYERMMVVDSIPPRSIWIAVFMIFIVLLKFALAAIDDVSEARLSKLSDEGNKKAQKALSLLDKASRVSNSLRMITVLLELLCAGITAWIVIDIVQNNSISWLLPVIMLLLSVIIWLFGIILSRRIASDRAEKVMFSLMWLINLIYYICLPFERALSAIVNFALRPLGVDATDDDDDDVTEEEIRFMVDIGSESGAIEQEEKEMIHNIFELNDTPVKDVMTHRTDVVFLWKEDGIDVWENTISETNHSVYPVCGETVDDIIGIIKAASFYKLLRNNDNEATLDRESIIKSPYLVPESIKADELFRQMQKNKNHFSIVLDEYGGLAGIITMSDLLEEIVGDLDNDAEAQEETEIEQLDSNTWKILGSTDIELVAEALNTELPIEDFKTFAGMILAELGAVPDDGTTAEVEAFGLQIKVTRIEEHRIEEALVCKLEQTPEEKE